MSEWFTSWLCKHGHHERTSFVLHGHYVYGSAVYGNPVGLCVHCGDIA